MTNRYQIIRLITKDQLGGVYLAKDTELEREVAFRNFSPGSGEFEIKDWEQAFTLYTERLKALQHPNVVPTFDAAVDDGDAIIINRVLETETLAEAIIEHGRFSVVETVNMAIDLLSAMQAAHEIGLYHGAMHTGSIKRIPISHGGHHYLVADFGLKYLSSLVKAEETHLEDPLLVAPELAKRGFEPDAPSDIFMIGQLCYTVLAGGHPFAEYSAEQCAKAYRSNKIPPLKKFNSKVPADLTTWLMQMIHGNVEKRFQSAEEALNALNAIEIAQPKKDTEIAPEIDLDDTPLILPHEPNTHVAAPDTAEAAITHTIKISTPKPVRNNRLRWSVATIAMLIIAGGLIFWQDPFQWRSGTEKNNKEAPEEPVMAQESEKEANANTHPEPKSITLMKRSMVNSIAKRRKPVAVPIETPRTVDWVITTGSPASQKRRQKTGGHYLQNIMETGGIQEFDFPYNPIRFLVGGKKIIPRAATDKQHHADIGQGWVTMLRTPPNHEGNLLVHYFITQWHCDLNIEIKNADQTTTLKVPATTPGVFRIPIKITGAKANEFYSIKITAASKHPKEGLCLGLNGIQVENLK
ncbi:protein kinase [Verrucomicrobiaceae bacterium N1E253]|uniref:Protein kinase n=1 Tax=Oceaniferula marina TaxID=2748318 RepID=A0A851GQD7_9BACT|nr:protein kinase [Oceaniferula marina]NWK56364.1 protein kinase [Oceaniferula marina]